MDHLREEVERASREIEEPGFWDKLEYAQKVVKEKKTMEASIKSVDDLNLSLDDMKDMIALAETEDDEDLADSLLIEFAEIKKAVEELRLKTLLTGKYDRNNAIVSIHAGTGGVDAMDWAEMLLRMYLRWCEKKGFKTRIIDCQDDTEAGIKSATFFAEGENVYGYLKNEIGVHRLVRISPFNAQGKRQTSFAKVEVVPELTEDVKVEIDPEDLRIDTFRSSGAGGQHINKTDSAIRITHIPTGIVVTCQNERSQFQNKDMAMRVLKARLTELAEKQHKEDIKELKGELKENTWGSQIRSYVFQPYTMVKDHRTNAEVANVTAVMDGDLDYFITAKLQQKDDKEQSI